MDRRAVPSTPRRAEGRSPLPPHADSHAPRDREAGAARAAGRGGVEAGEVERFQQRSADAEAEPDPGRDPAVERLVGEQLEPAGAGPRAEDPPHHDPRRVAPADQHGAHAEPGAVDREEVVRLVGRVAPEERDGLRFRPLAQCFPGSSGRQTVRVRQPSTGSGSRL